MKNLNLSKDEQIELDNYIADMNNKYAFEQYCGACDHFGTLDCPFNNKVVDNTLWKFIGCKKFFD